LAHLHSRAFGTMPRPTGARRAGPCDHRSASLGVPGRARRAR
jgi:hypothetical protein